MTAPQDDLVVVELRGVPVPLYGTTSEHHDGLRREFALISRGSPDDTSVTIRLRRLIDQLDDRFGAFTAEPTGVLREALRRGEETVDLAYRVPRDAGRAAQELDDLLDEADAFCRSGHLLTLATPPEPLALRRWFLGEFAAQTRGAPPTPWEQYAGRPATAG